MAGIIRRWILSRVVASGLSFETRAIDLYRGLRERLLASRRCDESLEGSLCHLLEEEERHRAILTQASTGRLSPEELDGIVTGHLYAGYALIKPLTGELLTQWEADLSAALEQEEKTWVFYGNLQRMSKIPVVKKAFAALASMEKEHVDILRKLLGRDTRTTEKG
jgi:rubrerythrin